MGLTRQGLWAHLGMLEIVAPIIAAGYEREALREWRTGSGDSPHGARWSTSFHASAFPSHDTACGRQALYTLMDIPDPEPRPPRLSAMFELGSLIEHAWVKRLAAEGVLLTADVGAGDAHQTGFADKEHWLTGASDAIILPPFWTKSHCVEIKTTHFDKVDAMRKDPNDTPMSHAKYLRQLKTYIALARLAPFTPTVVVCSESWAITTEQLTGLRWCPLHQTFDCATREITLDPPDDGTLIYGSREEPLTQVSYLVQHDEEAWQLGREKLAEWRGSFQLGEIPKHPHEGKRAMWGVPPCQYCSYKKEVCKPDYKAKVARLDDSAGIAFTKSVRPSYDYAKQRKAVLDRWGAEDLSETRA